ncbi:hypothetical protein ACFTRD_00595 [Paenibacillus sp. NPDC056933]
MRALPWSLDGVSKRETKLWITLHSATRTVATTKPGDLYGLNSEKGRP